MLKAESTASACIMKAVKNCPYSVSGFSGLLQLVIKGTVT